MFTAKLLRLLDVVLILQLHQCFGTDLIKSADIVHSLMYIQHLLIITESLFDVVNEVLDRLFVEQH